MASKVAKGPDYICIGMQKAGTGWLYDQLQFHPDFWMLPVNELHYWDWDFPGPNFLKNEKQYFKDTAAYGRDRIRRGVRPIDDRDTLFFQAIRDHVGQPRSAERYAGLFAGKGDLLSGDGTPGYSALKPDQVAALAASFPDVKIVLLVREPISRAWSQMMMRFRKDTLHNADFASLAAFRRAFEIPNVSTRSFATKTLDIWRASFPEEQVRVFLFDDIVLSPDDTRASILRFLGASEGAVANAPEASFNRKANKNYNIKMSDDIRAYLIDVFAEELLASAERYGGRARDWPAKYGL